MQLKFRLLPIPDPFQRDPRAQVTENKYDTEAWAQLVREAQSRLPTKGIHELRDLYEEILAIFPTAVRSPLPL